MISNISSVEDLSDNPSFIRWVEGTASEKEAREWDNWIRQDFNNQMLARAAQQEVLGITFVHPGNFDPVKEWELLEKRAGQTFRRKNPGKHTQSQNGYLLIRIAAVVFFMAITGIVTYLNYSGNSHKETSSLEWKHIKTAFGEQKTITLSDGSSIILNANSILSHPAGWIHNQAVEVHLKGEAFFQVTERTSPDDPAFRVKTHDGTVRVKGTKFVVTTNEDNTRVVLEKGAVAIIKEQKEVADGKEVYLRPHELAEFSRNSGSISIKKVPNTKVFTSWTDRVLVLDHSPFSYMVSRIEKTYGVNVVVNDSSLYERKLTGAIKMKSPNYLIRAISDVMGVTVSYSDGTVIFGKANSKNQ